MREFKIKRASSDVLTTNHKSVDENIRAVEGVIFKNEAELEAQAQKLIAEGHNPALVRCLKNAVPIFTSNSEGNLSIKDLLNFIQAGQGAKPINHAQLTESENFYTNVALVEGLYKKSPKFAQHCVDTAIFREIMESDSKLTPQETREKGAAKLMYNFYEAATDPEEYLSMELPK